jgi:hypothetical protein
MGPFSKRASENLREAEAFIPLVSPAPIEHFLKAKAAALYDRLVLIHGTPGSGKTTIARLVEFPTLNALLKNDRFEPHRNLISALAECGVINNNKPAMLACRLPLEADYRDLWELNYSEEARAALLCSFVQARAVLAWLRHLTQAGISPAQIELVFQPDRIGSIETIGGSGIDGILQRAREIESSIYNASGALVCPALESLGEIALGAYKPFDLIEKVRIHDAIGEGFYDVQLLVVFDDAQYLHPKQYSFLKRWLLRRELKVARWILSRLDVLNAQEALNVMATESVTEVNLPGVAPSRDTTDIFLQSSDRTTSRRLFRRMAKDMSSRYLKQIPLFSTRELITLESLMPSEPEILSKGKMEELANEVEKTQRRLGLSDGEVKSLKKKAADYFTKVPKEPDVELAMLKIMMDRHSRRVNRELFDPEDYREPARPVQADSSLYKAARLQLWHQYQRPLFYGIDELCDASTENAELFLRLAQQMVEASADQIQRKKSPAITAGYQNQLLNERAGQIIKQWDFPEFQNVRKLADWISKRCLEVSLQPNAWIGAGANAFGIPQAEFENLSTSHPFLANVLKYGVAYNALTLVPRYECKKQVWCLFELGGVIILRDGLTLSRGGFIEGTVSELDKVLAP